MINNKYYWIGLVYSTFFFSGCEAYLDFERKRMEFIIYFIIITTVIGIIGILFSEKKKR